MNGNVDKHTRMRTMVMLLDGARVWHPRLMDRWGFIDYVFRSMARDWYSEAVAPPTALCTMGVSWPSRRGTGNDGLERIFGRPTDVLSSPIKMVMVTWTLGTWTLGT